MQCGVCGGTEFTSREVLWDGLVRDWQLSPRETEYVNRQQGMSCNRCGANLRSIALANALRAYLSSEAVLVDTASARAGDALDLLEINEAGTLTPVLRKFSGYRYVAYPEVDMHALPFDDGSFDLVIHSDTLEHVANPVHALTECRRVLRAGGALCFTIPIIVGRMSRSRDGLPPSHHGDAQTAADDLIVHTEFGADAWTLVLEAGFSQVELHAVQFPAAIALLARNGPAPG
jgi:SAM-dependent methyltransferase